MEYAIGLYDFKADEGNEISTYKNEILEVVKKEETGGLCAINMVKQGWSLSTILRHL